jgi:hypothetical protein
MDKVFFGVISYGPQPGSFWLPYSNMLALLGSYDIAYMGQSNGKSMRADGNRNQVVQSFLKTKADWLMWIDADNVIPLGGIRRLLDTQKTLVTGLYYIKVPPHDPVAFERTSAGTFKTIKGWSRGEIVPVDMAGMGACLSHRSVFEDIKKQCVVVQKSNGGIFAFHKDRIYGKPILEKPKYMLPSIVDGTYKENVFIPNHDYGPFPYFDFGFGRSEDVLFYELASQCGHKAWCDTSVECNHINTEWTIGGEQYRDEVKRSKIIIPLVKDFVSIEMDEVDVEEKMDSKSD